MRTRTTLAGAVLAVGAPLGWLTASGKLTTVLAQDKTGQARENRQVLARRRKTE